MVAVDVRWTVCLMFCWYIRVNRSKNYIKNVNIMTDMVRGSTKSEKIIPWGQLKHGNLSVQIAAFQSGPT